MEISTIVKFDEKDMEVISDVIELSEINGGNAATGGKGGTLSKVLSSIGLDINFNCSCNHNCACQSRK